MRLVVAIASVLLLVLPAASAYSETKVGIQPPGRVTFDVSIPALWGLNGAAQYATGSCSVSDREALVQGPFSFVCGTDRDDDTLLTNFDNSPNDAGGVSTDSDNFDDDYATASSGSSSSASVNVCFRSDVAHTAASLGALEDSAGSVNGDGSWDDVIVQILPGSSFFGAFDATLTLNAAAGCSGNVSGHTHG